MKAKKPDAAAPASQDAPVATGRQRDDRKGTSLRLSPEAWRELKLLALDDGKPMHDLLLEAIDDYLTKRGRPAVARAR